MNANEKLKHAIATNDANLAQTALDEGANPYVQVHGQSAVMALSAFTPKHSFSSQVWDVVEKVYATIPSNQGELLELQESVLQVQYQNAKASSLSSSSSPWKEEAAAGQRYAALVASSASWMAFRRLSDRLPESQNLTSRLTEMENKGALDGELASLKKDYAFSSTTSPFLSSPTPSFLAASQEKSSFVFNQGNEKQGSERQDAGFSFASPQEADLFTPPKILNDVGDYYDQVPQLTVARIRQKRQLQTPSPKVGGSDPVFG